MVSFETNVYRNLIIVIYTSTKSFFLLIGKTLTTVITHDRGGEWKTIPLTPEQCKEVKLEVNTQLFTV